MQTLTFPYNASSVILPIVLRDDLGQLITGVAFNDADLTVEYLLPSGTSFTTVTAVTATAGTYTSSGWIEVNSGAYQLGLPAAAVNAGGYTTVRVTYGTNSPQFFHIQFTAGNVVAIEGTTTPYTGISLIQMFRGILSMAVGNLTGNGTTLRDPNDETNVAQFTTGSGNRTRTGLDLDDPTP